MLAIKSQWLGRRRGAAAVDVSHQPRAFAALPARLQRAGHYSARPLRVRAAAAEQDAATETPDQFKDELGELAVKIEQVAKSVDEGLKARAAHHAEYEALLECATLCCPTAGQKVSLS